MDDRPRGLRRMCILLRRAQRLRFLGLSFLGRMVLDVVVRLAHSPFIAAREDAPMNVETVKIDGMEILARRGMAIVYANRTQAEKAAAKCGGMAFQSRRSARFMVEVPAPLVAQ